jgi:hypothetical protein
MQDFLLLRAGEKFRRGSGISIEREFSMWTALLCFLQDNKLKLTTTVLTDQSELEGLELRSVDLTEAGVDVMRCGLDKWLKGLDRGKDPSDVAVFTKCLAKVQAG